MAVHIFTPHSDVPDDGALRLIFWLQSSPIRSEESRAGI